VLCSKKADAARASGRHDVIKIWSAARHLRSFVGLVFGVYKRPDARAASAFLSRAPSTNGPFQTERTMSGVPYFFRLWRLMRMNLLVDLLERVFLPLVGLPHGVTG